jgi:hypothetical protein
MLISGPVSEFSRNGRRLKRGRLTASRENGDPGKYEKQAKHRSPASY